MRILKPDGTTLFDKPKAFKSNTKAPFDSRACLADVDDGIEFGLDNTDQPGWYTIEITAKDLVSNRVATAIQKVYYQR